MIYPRTGQMQSMAWITATDDEARATARATEAIACTATWRREVEELTHTMREVLTSFRLELAIADRGLTV